MVVLEVTVLHSREHPEELHHCCFGDALHTHIFACKGQDACVKILQQMAKEQYRRKSSAVL